MITNLSKHDLIYNSLMVGFGLKDALVYAGCTEAEMEEELQNPKWAQLGKQFEYSLLEKLQTVADKQMNMGKETALTWLLERVNPEKWGKVVAQNEGQPITINLDSGKKADVEYDS